MAVPNAAGELDPVALEESLMATWSEEDTFGQQVASRKDGQPFIFLEGPPTTLPEKHLPWWTTFVKHQKDFPGTKRDYIFGIPTHDNLEGRHVANSRCG